MPEQSFPISLTENKNFLTGKADVTLNVTGDANFIQRLLTKQPFPADDTQLGNLAVKASVGTPDISFGEGRGTVSFSASAGAFGSIGIYHKASALVDALQFIGDDASEKESLSSALILPQADNQLFVVLSWGYDVSAAVKGSVALGAPGTVDFGISAGRDALFAVICRFQNDVTSDQGVAKTVQSWKLPSQLQSDADLAPGTWIISEVNGSVYASLGATLGYNFSFIRNARLGGLSGDIGLKVQLGLQTAFGLNASGRYAVVVGRPSDDRRLRLSLYKLKLHGWSFALSASALVTTTTPLPATSDDFIKAVFGVHGVQIAKDLALVDKMASLDPKNLPGVLAGVSVDYLSKLVTQLTGIDAAKDFTNAKTKLMNALNVWDNLATTGQGAAMKLWTMLEKGAGIDLGPLQGTLKQIAGLKTPTDFKALFESLLTIKGFDQSPVGQFLFSVLANGPLQATVDNGAFGRLQTVAGLAAKLLDGSAVQDVISKLQQFVNDKLDLATIEDAIKSADLSKLDDLLKAKLAEFLSKELDLPLLGQIRDAIQKLEAKREQIYSEVQKALNHDYSFNFAENYQSTTTDTAVADMEFDFSGTEAPPGSVSALFQQAVDGRIGDLLISGHPGITVHSGMLSHGVKRDNHIEVTMPFFNFSEDHINDVTASLQADHSSGRGIYLLSATDSVARTVQHSKTLSSLSIGLQVPAVKKFSPLSASYAASLRQFVPNMQTQKLIDSLQPYADLYFGSQFKSRTFADWVRDLDNNIGKIAPSFTGSQFFGDALISLDVSLQESAITAWFASPMPGKAPVYYQLSLALQRAFKRLLPFQFFQDLHQYANLDSSAALLVYAAIDPMNDMSLDPEGQPQPIEPKEKGDLIWGFQGSDAQPLREAIINNTAQSLVRRLEVISPMLKAAGLDPHGFYDPGQLAVNRIRAAALDPSSVGGRDLDSVLFTERQVIFGARDAAVNLAKFLGDPASADPASGLKELTSFGQKITATFNDHLDFIFNGPAFRPLGTLVFLEAARVLAGSVGPVPDPAALLGVAALKGGSSFTGDLFLQGDVPGADDTLVSEHVPSATPLGS